MYLSAPSATAVTVKYRVTGGSATAGTDYVLAAGRLTFAPNQSRKEIVLKLLPDALAEGDETIVITLHAPTGGTLGTDSVLTFTVRDTGS